MASRPTRQTAYFDRYELLERVGEGGYGTVYKARHRFLEEIFALKVLPPALRADEVAMARFEREVKALRRLDHPNVVKVSDAGIEERSGSPYLAMTFVEGETLHHRVEERGALPVEEVVRIGWQIADALHHVHTRDAEHPLVHRDVKPSNIILTPDGRAVLTDFGIAFSEALPRISREAIGTPEFMSPEQADGKALDGRSDVYSLGVVLYESLAGRIPFEATSESPSGLAHLIRGILYDDPDPVSAHRPDVPEWLEAIVMRCLAKAPEDRYASAGVLAEALRTGHPHPDGQVAAPPRAQPSRTQQSRPAATSRKTQRSIRAASTMVPPPSEAAHPPVERKRRGVAITVVVGFLMLVLAGAAFAWFGNGTSPFAANKPSGDPRVATLLSEADSALANDRLTTPKGESALDMVEAVEEIDPENDQADWLRDQIIKEYEGWGDKARKEANFAEALKYYEQAMAVATDTSEALQQKHDEVATLAAQAQEIDGRNKGQRKKNLRERLGW
ncbi:MAG TPA: protein kinase [Rhodothermales bacterium]|nr:protein kinase [Rhodothermales bacterium]